MAGFCGTGGIGTAKLFFLWDGTGLGFVEKSGQNGILPCFDLAFWIERQNIHLHCI